MTLRIVGFLDPGVSVFDINRGSDSGVGQPRRDRKVIAARLHANLEKSWAEGAISLIVLRRRLLALHPSGTASFDGVKAGLAAPGGTAVFCFGYRRLWFWLPHESFGQRRFGTACAFSVT